jgi:hypothetical protein
MAKDSAPAAQHGWARFWAVDLHVHTPGSNDAKDEDFGDAGAIVRAALDASLDAIAVTDHNTAAWCDQMTAAAEGTGLLVLPGFELSTSDGHLLGIWEEGTPASKLEDVLIRLGIGREQFGHLDIVGAKGMAECAKEIADGGGIAIAAHIDKEKGLLKQPVQTHVNKLLSDKNIAAYEFVKADVPARVEAKLGNSRHPALVQSSDAYSAALSRHSATGIGVRRTWIKAASPDLCGIRYAFDDPDLRTTLDDPALAPTHPTIDGVYISGGFLPGATIGLSPDLNCFLGGTGAGKSLVLEAIRFALDQQVDQSEFGPIYDEVQLRLAYALGDGTEVQVRASVDGQSYRIRRTFDQDGSLPVVEQDVDGDWVEIEREPSSLLGIAAFSQGEILEYARQPVGRVGLVDAHLDLADIEERIETAESDLEDNIHDLIQAKARVDRLIQEAAKVTSLQARETELSALFDPKLVKQQGLWTSELGELKSLDEQVGSLAFKAPKAPAAIDQKIPSHKSQFAQVKAARMAYVESVEAAGKLVDKGVSDYQAVVDDVRATLDVEFKAFQAKLDETIEKSGNTSLASLRRELSSVQASLAKAKAAAAELKDEAQPDLDQVESDRETLLTDLKRARDERRALRRARVRELNAKTAGFVKLDIPAKGDTRDFRAALDKIKVGSRLSDTVLGLIAENLHPYSFARALWAGDTSKVGKLPAGITLADIARLQGNVAERDLWAELLYIQQVDCPDTLSVKFKKPEGTDYIPIENLSHGQKCTAILVILLADGETPVLIDQPEDALHAPWIEDYLVDRLRELRGTRQYIFATRSSGLVVSADSEQLITMRATADRGEVEASGSLERHDLNKLALHHLEGGKVPFGRRARKLGSSIAN